MCIKKKLKYLPHTCWWLNKCRGYFSVSGEVLPENLNTFPWRPLASNMTFAKAHQSSSQPNIHWLCQLALCSCLTNRSTMHPPQFHMLDSNSLVATKPATGFVYEALNSLSKMNVVHSQHNKVLNASTITNWRGFSSWLENIAIYC